MSSREGKLCFMFMLMLVPSGASVVKVLLEDSVCAFCA